MDTHSYQLHIDYCCIHLRHIRHKTNIRIFCILGRDELNLRFQKPIHQWFRPLPSPNHVRSIHRGNERVFRPAVSLQDRALHAVFVSRQERECSFCFLTRLFCSESLLQDDQFHSFHHFLTVSYFVIFTRLSYPSADAVLPRSPWLRGRSRTQDHVLPGTWDCHRALSRAGPTYPSACPSWPP